MLVVAQIGMLLSIVDPRVLENLSLILSVRRRHLLGLPGVSIERPDLIGIISAHLMGCVIAREHAIYMSCISVSLTNVCPKGLF